MENARFSPTGHTLLAGGDIRCAAERVPDTNPACCTESGIARGIIARSSQNEVGLSSGEFNAHIGRLETSSPMAYSIAANTKLAGVEEAGDALMGDRRAQVAPNT